MLHLTNGDHALEALRAAQFEGGFLPWRDVLHEGPVPEGLGLAELSQLRAGFIASCGWGAREDLERAFRSRDAVLEASVTEEEVVLWFESDLYDQLQLCQVLAWYCDQPSRPLKLSLICVDRDPKDGRFRGLAERDPASLQTEYARRVTVSKAQLERAAAAWAAFRAPQLRALDRFRLDGTPELPFLAAALGRLLEELPSLECGLSRTEQAVLEAARTGVASPWALFGVVHAAEERPFMSDWSFWRVFGRLVEPPEALLELEDGGRPRFPPAVPDDDVFRAQRFRITEAGTEVLQGRRDATQTIGVDRWIGGTHLSHSGSVMRWSGAFEGLVDCV